MFFPLCRLVRKSMLHSSVIFSCSCQKMGFITLDQCFKFETKLCYVVDIYLHFIIDIQNFLIYDLFVSAESKSTADSSRDQPTPRDISSTNTSMSNAESNSSTSKLEEELKISPHLRKFSFNDLKLATRNFRPESLLGEGGFGCVFKGWVEENGTAPVKPGTGLTVAVKTLNHDGLQGHKEWMV